METPTLTGAATAKVDAINSATPDKRIFFISISPMFIAKKCSGESISLLV
jgi:hypothetical protein